METQNRGAGTRAWNFLIRTTSRAYLQTNFKPNPMNNCNFLFIGVFAVLFSCTKQSEFKSDFNSTNDRIWIGENFWAIPMEDWKIADGRVEGVGEIPNARVNILTWNLSAEDGDFELSAKMGLLKSKDNKGTAGFLIGLYDEQDPDVKAACYFGKGIKAGISLSGKAFLGEELTDLPEGFNAESYTIKIEGNNQSISMIATDASGINTQTIKTKVDGVKGLVALAKNMSFEKNQKPGMSDFWFDDIKLSGSKVIEQPENSFGPILWTTYTLSQNTVKLMAQMPPLGKSDNQYVELQLKENENWKKVSTKAIEADSRTAIFTLENWDSSIDKTFRVLYAENDKDGKATDSFYEGTIRQEPLDRPLKVAGLTCQNHVGFPYSPLVKNLEVSNPDLLYFSGDQIYEGNGGYGVKRTPVDASILSYLGKYYLFGWTFGNVMRDRPTICTPDDHDVFHGNLWGEGGKLKEKVSDDESGFVQSVRMVNAVNLTQCGNLPDPYDPSPIKNGMSVWYTDLVYGRVSFAVVSDRIFKTGPEKVATWEGRHDQMKVPLQDLSILDAPGLELLGERQEKFLEEWAEDWQGADMKVLLSQTVFANLATHYGGSRDVFHGDLDSGGWPKIKRDRVVDILRKCFAFHINGDQHLPSLVQYGINNYRDAGWSFCTPAIAVGYQRAFWPDELGWPVKNRPEHDLPNTGEYLDAFGNKSFVYAVGLPDKQGEWDNRYIQANKRTSGFGMITFDQKTRDITIDCYTFLADLTKAAPNNQFQGWPVTINQLENYGRRTELSLPTLKLNKPNQVIKILDSNGEIVYNLRIEGDSFTPKIFNKGIYTILIGEGENIKEVKNVSTGSKESIEIEL